MKIFALFICIIACACNNSAPSNADETPANPAASKDASTTPAASRECFAYQSPTDTVKLSLTVTTSGVTGDLYYAYSEKDRNKGTITGTMHGDTLLADYTFMSEGMQSVRQVAFLKKGDGFIEGYTESKMENGKMRFENISALKFVGNMPLTKYACDSL